jgi:predicted alpha-1,2-mannosidase
MKTTWNNLLSCTMLALAIHAGCPAWAQNLTDYVDPFIGTSGMGHTFPGACVPFGGVQLSPDTDTIPHNVSGRYQPEVYSLCAGYRYEDPTIVGFSHTHLSGTGHSDLGDILLMPTTGPLHLNPGTADAPETGYRSRYSHSSETAHPGYYAVTLEDYGIRAELSATARTGIHRYTYPGEGERHLVMDLSHGIYNYEGKTLWASVRVVSPTLVTGYRITQGWAREHYTYFAVRFSRPIRDYGCRESVASAYQGFWRKFSTGHHFPEMAGRGLSLWFDFDWADAAADDLTVQVALSATSAEGALRNLEAEDGSFDGIRASAGAAWERELGKVSAEGTDEELKMLYTSLYHTMINPSVYDDVDGAYRGLDGSIHQADGWNNYTVFSLWDTYRAEHPLLLLMHPGRARDMALSMLAHQEQSAHGLLPIWSLMANEGWCMSGYHAVSVLSDAVSAGIGLPGDRALEAMDATATVPYLEGLEDYMKIGYVPLEASSTGASTTLEYAYDDWTIYRAAKLLGNKSLAREYRDRAFNYLHLFPFGENFAQARYRDGRWKKNFDPRQTYGEGFIEGNSYNFSFHVPHDVAGLIGLMGEKQFLRQLDTLFSEPLDPRYYADNEDIEESCLIGGYVHGNEPSHHIPYLFAWTSKPWKGEYWLREIMERMYRPVRDGLGGNDDCGQMSAWYIFSAMGFYPVCPGSGEFVLGAPFLPRMTLQLEGGKSFTVLAPGVSSRNRYVQRVKLNGKKLTRRYLTREDILSGGVLEFEMGPRPLKRGAPRQADLPYSLSRE